MNSILNNAPVSPDQAQVAEPHGQLAPPPADNDGQINPGMLPIIALITGFSLVRLGVPLWIAVGLVAVATTIGLIRRAYAV